MEFLSTMLRTYLSNASWDWSPKLAVVTLILLFTWSICWWVEPYYCWKRQGVRYIKPKKVLDCFLRKRSDQLHESEQTWYNTLKRIYGRFDGRLPVLTIGDPMILKKVFLKHFSVFQTRRDMKFNCPIMDKTLFGLVNPDWKRVRNIVSKTFIGLRLKTMLSVLEDSCDYLIDNFTESYNTSGVVNCQKEFEKFVLHAIGTCAFGMDMSGLDDPDNEFVKHSRNLFKQPGDWKTSLITSYPLLVKIFRIKLLNADSTDFFRAAIVKALEERKNSDVDRNDFLQMIMNAENDCCNTKKLDHNNNEGGFDACPYSKAEDNGDVETPMEEELQTGNKKGLSHDEVLSQCATFFMAGSDSTCSLLTNVVYHLTKNRDCQERVYQEIQERDTSKGLYENLRQMKYLEGVISESLRMVPAMVRLERSVHEDYDVETDEGKIHLKKGMLVNIPTYAIHHDEDYFPQPERFLPERFLNFGMRKPGMACVLSPPNYAFQGFGEGNRKCIAFRFVYMWTKLCLVKILENFELVECASTANSLEVTENLGLLRIAPLEVGLRPRYA